MDPCTFLLVKGKIWKPTFTIKSKLWQNCTEKQIIRFKTTVNWLFNNMWCYLVIAFFDGKIGVFQQTVVRVYFFLKYFVKKLKHFYVTAIMIFIHSLMGFKFTFCSRWMETINAKIVTIIFRCYFSYQCGKVLHKQVMPFFSVCDLS